MPPFGASFGIKYRVLSAGGLSAQFGSLDAKALVEAPKLAFGTICSAAGGRLGRGRWREKS